MRPPAAAPTWPTPLNSPVTATLLVVLVFYGFVYTPVVSYVSARMEGIVGMSVNVPFVREATFILTGYKGAAIWFAPFPAYNYGAQTSYFRQTELTGTKITSMVKAEAFVLPIVDPQHAPLQPVHLAHRPGPQQRVPVRQPVLGADRLPLEPCS